MREIKDAKSLTLRQQTWMNSLMDEGKISHSRWVAGGRSGGDSGKITLNALENLRLIRVVETQEKRDGAKLWITRIYRITKKGKDLMDTASHFRD